MFEHSRTRPTGLYGGQICQMNNQIKASQLRLQGNTDRRHGDDNSLQPHWLRAKNVIVFHVT